MKFIDLFSGIGGFRSALEELGHECIAYSEIDKFAIKSYKAIYDTDGEIELGNISEISDEYISKLQGEVDIVVGGSPCFRKGTLITTKEGLKPIEDIKKGDYVLTHNNRYKEVVVPMVNPAKEIYSLKVMNSVETYVTPEHPVRAIEKFSKYNSKERKYDISFSKPKWIKVKDLQKGKHYIQLGKSSEETNPDNITKEEAWLIGRYIADGYLLTSKRSGRKNSFRRDVVFCVGKDKKLKFENKLSEYTMNPSEEKTVYKYRKQNERLFNLVSKCGRGSENKEIPQEYLNLPSEILEELIEGYLSGDGSCSNGVYSFTTVSEKLALSLVSGLNNVYKNGASITFSERPKKHIIEGREVNQKDTYRIQLRKEYNKGREPQTLKIDDFLYAPIKKIEIQETSETVYNFEVEDDNSYVANNMVVHNCQSFSIAGNRGGFDDTRGTLFFEYARTVKDIQPKYFIFENVKGMLSHDKGNTIRTVLNTFNDLGYYIDFNVFNSKFYDVPQNRERIYIVGKRKDLVDKPKYQEKVKGKKKFDEIHNWAVDNINYVELLPQLKTEVTTRLIDVLEDEVDEKYYLSEEKTKKLTLDNDLGGKLNMYDYNERDRVHSVNKVSPTLNTMQGGDRQPKVAVIGNTSNTGHGGSNVYNANGIAPTITARDCNGPKQIAVREATKQGYAIAEQGDSVNVTYPDSKTRRGRVGKQVAQTLQAGEVNQGVVINDKICRRCNSKLKPSDLEDYEYVCFECDENFYEFETKDEVKAIIGSTQKNAYVGDGSTSPSLTSAMGQGGGHVPMPVYSNLRIRKLTPLECWRLQSFTDEQFYKAKDSGVSNSQLYKQAGNAVTVNVVKYIAKKLFNE